MLGFRCENWDYTSVGLFVKLDNVLMLCVKLDSSSSPIAELSSSEPSPNGPFFSNMF